MKIPIFILSVIIIHATFSYAADKPLPGFLANGLIDQDIPLKLLKSNAEFPKHHNIEHGWKKFSNGSSRSTRVRPQNGFFIDWDFMGTNVDGKLHGKAYKYYSCSSYYSYPGGDCKKWNLLSFTTYDMGVKHGESRRWDQYGDLWYVTIYDNEEEVFRENHMNDTVVGTSIEIGEKTYKTTTLHDGVKFSQEIRSGRDRFMLDRKVYREYYPSGQLKEERNYKDGWEHGFVRSYYENGQLKNERQMLDGKKVGISYKYDENGKEIERTYHEDWGKPLQAKIRRDKIITLIKKTIVEGMKKHKIMIILILSCIIGIVTVEKITGLDKG